MWAEKIDIIRAAGYKWREIAEICGLTVGSVHDLWTERSKQPSGDAAVAINKLLAKVQRKGRKA